MSVKALAQALGYSFNDPQLLATALRHRSFGLPHNERLEFLGDGVLNCAVAEALYERFPQLDEGVLSRLRAALVRQETLHQVAEQLSLGTCLQLGEGELRSGGHRRPSILADALEAVFGAIHLDGGFVAAAGVIGRLFAPYLMDIDPARDAKDAKTRLQEWLQARRLDVPVYRVIATDGGAHNQRFHVRCDIAAQGIRADGQGASRRKAEQAAAEAALALIERNIHE